MNSIKTSSDKLIFNYITTNLITGHKYIGMHVTNNVSDGYLGSGVALKDAIKKYGKESFTRDILCFCSDVSVAYYNEGLFISEYNTLIPNGYNISATGGISVSGMGFTDEHKRKISDAVRIAKTGTKQSNATREKRRASMIGKNKGKKRTPESIQKQVNKQKGLKHTEEQNKRKSERQKGLKHKKHKPMSAQARKNIGDAVRRRYGSIN